MIKMSFFLNDVNTAFCKKDNKLLIVPFAMFCSLDHCYEYLYNSRFCTIPNGADYTLFLVLSKLNNPHCDGFLLVIHFSEQKEFFHLNLTRGNLIKSQIHTGH